MYQKSNLHDETSYQRTKQWSMTMNLCISFTAPSGSMEEMQFHSTYIMFHSNDMCRVEFKNKKILGSEQHTNWRQRLKDISLFKIIILWYPTFISYLSPGSTNTSINIIILTYLKGQMTYQTLDITILQNFDRFFTMLKVDTYRRSLNRKIFISTESL